MWCEQIFVLSRRDCLGDVMDVKVVIEVGVGVVEIGVEGEVCGVRMGVAVSCMGTRGKGVVSTGGSVNVADGGGTG